MRLNKELLKQLPGVDTLLKHSSVKGLLEQYDEQMVKYAIRETLNTERARIINGGAVESDQKLVETIATKCHAIGKSSLQSVINATGVIVHTNLGRAPLGKKLTEQALKIVEGYNNLEFDLDKGARGSRHTHVTEILKYLTDAEDVLVVNNNAAAIMLVLRTFAKNREVIISRSELIEIGGSFRLPDIMAASDCKMVEIGTTNKTKITDFENARSENTALLFKAHRSNFSIQGFTAEVDLPGLVAFGKKHSIPVVYDIGSGLLRKPNELALSDEPDVKQALKQGADLVCFSGDKLLGGPQAGIIAGKKEVIAKLKKEQMTRALRVGKVTLALLEAACRNYLDDEKLFSDNMIFSLLRKTPEEIKVYAERLKTAFAEKGIDMKIVPNKALYGGGTMPDKSIDSFALTLNQKFPSAKAQSLFSEKLHYGLMKDDSPVVGILKKGIVFFDVLTILEKDEQTFIDVVSEHINKLPTNIKKQCLRN